MHWSLRTIMMQFFSWFRKTFSFSVGMIPASPRHSKPEINRPSKTTPDVKREMCGIISL